MASKLKVEAESVRQVVSSAGTQGSCSAIRARYPKRGIFRVPDRQDAGCSSCHHGERTAATDVNRAHADRRRIASARVSARSRDLEVPSQYPSRAATTWEL